MKRKRRPITWYEISTTSRLTSCVKALILFCIRTLMPMPLYKARWTRSSNVVSTCWVSTNSHKDWHKLPHFILALLFGGALKHIQASNVVVVVNSTTILGQTKCLNARAVDWKQIETCTRQEIYCWDTSHKHLQTSGFVIPQRVVWSRIFFRPEKRQKCVKLLSCLLTQRFTRFLCF